MKQDEIDKQLARMQKALSKEPVLNYTPTYLPLSPSMMKLFKNLTKPAKRTAHSKT